MTTPTNDELREALEHIWGGGIDYALSPDFKDLTPDEKDALYIRYRDNLIEKAERIISQDRKRLLERVEGLMPDAEKMPAILMGGRDYAYQGYATSAYKYAIEEVQAILKQLKEEI